MKKTSQLLAVLMSGLLAAPMAANADLISVSVAEPGTVVIDIKPGSDPNSIDLKSKKEIPVAILTTGSFYALEADPLSVQFGPDGATEPHGRAHVKDVDGDGDSDMVLHFNTQDTGIQCDDTEATLTGKTFGGDAFTGTDAVNIVKCPKPGKKDKKDKKDKKEKKDKKDKKDKKGQTGVFLDSPVINIGYSTETILREVTNARGEYNYLHGEIVTFFIGDLEFPPVLATGVVTPLELTGSTDTSDRKVVNMIRLLQTLDQDGNPDNGISITETAKTAASSAVDFDQDTVDFEKSTTVLELIEEADAYHDALISVTDAVEHFEEELVAINEVDVVGTWSTEDSDSDLLRIIFFEDGTYLQTEAMRGGSMDEYGMEWGFYSRDAMYGRVTATQTFFESNGALGLTRFVNGGEASSLFTTVSGDELTATIDDNGDGTIDDTILFQRGPSAGILGSWINSTTPNELLVFVFSDDGTYVHAEVDLDDPGEKSGMEWGTFSRDAKDGLTTITGMLFDENGDTGLTELIDPGPDGAFLYINIDGDVLTLEVDEYNDGTIEETLIFARLP